MLGARDGGRRSSGANLAGRGYRSLALSPLASLEEASTSGIVGTPPGFPDRLPDCSTAGFGSYAGRSRNQSLILLRAPEAAICGSPPIVSFNRVMSSARFHQLLALP
jgi:hypothetical protein